MYKALGWFDLIVAVLMWAVIASAWAFVLDEGPPGMFVDGDASWHQGDPW